jgi:drug/metabolite transporter (DMT)-like permease
MRIFSILLIVVSNVIYQVSQKSVPHGAHPLVATIVAYCVSLVLCFALLPFMPLQTSIGEAVRELNWASYALGASIVGVELGFLLAYRAGWDISIGAVIANALLMAILVPIGVLVFKEELTASRVVGMLLCVAGVVLIARK